MLFRPCYWARGVASIPCIDLTPQSCPLCKIMELISVTLPIAVLTLVVQVEKAVLVVCSRRQSARSSS